MCKSKTAAETAGQEILRLIQEIPDSDKDLRERIQKAIGDLELHKSYGLRFERHLPEVIDSDGEQIGLTTPYYPYLEHVDSVAGENPEGPEHILLEADNYVALKYLQYTHEGKIDVIYIDPPYNTGSKDWKYNNDYVDGEDIFRHSKWLSFMEKRLRLAKKLLKPDGVLICAIDHYELFPLGMLLEEIFKSRVVTQTVVVNNPAGRVSEPFSICHEYHLVVHQKGRKAKPVKKKAGTRVGYHERPFRKADDVSGNREQRPNMFYPIWVKKEDLKIVEIGQKLEKQEVATEREGCFTVLPIDNNGKERRWRWNTSGLKDRLRENPGAIIAKRTRNGVQIYITEEVKETEKPKTIWIGPEHNYATGGTSVLNNLLPKTNFIFPKSTETVKFAIDRFLPKNGICLDFFAGSGTTFQAVAELNESDNGTRQCILVTNNESNICREVTWERVKRVTTGTHAYPECTKKYNGNPSAHATFYKVAIQPEDKIERTIRGWKKTIEPYLPLISTKLNVPFNWKPIKDVKLGFISKDVAVIPDAAYLEWKWEGIKSHKIAHICIIGDDIEDYEGIQKALKMETTATRFTFLPKQYLEYFDGFHSKGAI